MWTVLTMTMAQKTKSKTWFNFRKIRDKQNYNSSFISLLPEKPFQKQTKLSISA
jgi:hypothetical protein